MNQKIQYCEVCGEPTGRCEDDSIDIESHGEYKTVCESCYDKHKQEQKWDN